jgi:hypothetical protein
MVTHRGDKLRSVRYLLGSAWNLLVQISALAQFNRGELARVDFDALRTDDRGRVTVPMWQLHALR